MGAGARASCALWSCVSAHKVGDAAPPGQPITLILCTEKLLPVGDFNSRSGKQNSGQRMDLCSPLCTSPARGTCKFTVPTRHTCLHVAMGLKSAPLRKPGEASPFPKHTCRSPNPQYPVLHNVMQLGPGTQVRRRLYQQALCQFGCVLERRHRLRGRQGEASHHSARKASP